MFILSSTLSPAYVYMRSTNPYMFKMNVTIISISGLVWLYIALLFSRRRGFFSFTPIINTSCNRAC